MPDPCADLPTFVNGRADFTGHEGDGIDGINTLWPTYTAAGDHAIVFLFTRERDSAVGAPAWDPPSGSWLPVNGTDGLLAALTGTDSFGEGKAWLYAFIRESITSGEISGGAMSWIANGDTTGDDYRTIALTQSFRNGIVDIASYDANSNTSGQPWSETSDGFAASDANTWAVSACFGTSTLGSGTVTGYTPADWDWSGSGVELSPTDIMSAAVAFIASTAGSNKLGYWFSGVPTVAGSAYGIGTGATPSVEFTWQSGMSNDIQGALATVAWLRTDCPEGGYWGIRATAV